MRYTIHDIITCIGWMGRLCVSCVYVVCTSTSREHSRILVFILDKVPTYPGREVQSYVVKSF